MRVTGRMLTAGLAAIFGVAGVIGLVLPQLLSGLRGGSAIVLCIGAALLGAMAAANRDPMATAIAPAPVTRRYLRELLVTMTAYVVVLACSLWLLKRIEPTLLRAAVALLPLLPIALAVRAVVRFTRALDEMQQRIEFESAAIAAVVVSMLYLTGGLLQSAEMFHVPGEVAMMWVFPLIAGFYGIARGFVARRYE